MSQAQSGGKVGFIALPIETHLLQVLANDPDGRTATDNQKGPWGLTARLSYPI